MAGTAINVTGTGLADITSILILRPAALNSTAPGSTGGNGMQLAGVCNVSTAAPGWAACAAMPSLAGAGLYWLVLARANGEQSVDVLKASTVVVCLTYG